MKHTLRYSITLNINTAKLNGECWGLLTSDGGRSDEAPPPDGGLGGREAELTGHGRVRLGGVEHGRAQVGRGGVVHLEGGGGREGGR